MGIFVYGCTTSEQPQEDVTQAPVRKNIRSLFSVEGSSGFPDSLANPFPNPYNRQLGDTTIFIGYTLADSAVVKVIIQNPIGDSVAIFEDAKLPGGVYKGWWTPVNSLNQPLRAGLYFITLRADPDRRNYIDSKLLYIENND